MLAGNRRVVRKSEARMACSPDGRLHMLVREPEFCHYVFVIYSPALCQVGSGGEGLLGLGPGDGGVYLGLVVVIGGGGAVGLRAVCVPWAGSSLGVRCWWFGGWGGVVSFCNLADASPASIWPIVCCATLLAGGEVQAGGPGGGGQEGLPGGG